MADATLPLSYGRLEARVAADGGVTLETFGPRGGYNANFETPFAAQLIRLLERVVAGSGERGVIDAIYTEPLPNSDRRLVAREGWRGMGSVQLHTSRPDLPEWRRDTVGAPLLELPVADLPAVIALLRDAAPSPRRGLRLV